MNEFKYYDVPSPFPTLARGLYSQKLGGGDGGGERHRIVARGYDKFFNIGEVPWTTVRDASVVNIDRVLTVFLFASGHRLRHIQSRRTPSRSNPTAASFSSLR